MEIRDYLASDDIEIIQLGLSLISSLSLEEQILLLEDMNPHFSFNIINGAPQIYKRMGLWEQLKESDYKINYNNKLDLTIFTEVINEYINSKNEDKNQRS